MLDRGAVIKIHAHTHTHARQIGSQIHHLPGLRREQNSIIGKYIQCFVDLIQHPRRYDYVNQIPVYDKDIYTIVLTSSFRNKLYIASLVH